MNALTPRLRPTLRTWARLAGTVWVAGALLLGSPGLSAQSSSQPGPLRENWSVTAMAGVLRYGPSADEGFPTFSVRADTPLADYARLEVGATYARPDVQQDDDFVYDPSLPTKSANLFSLTVGVQFRHAFGPLEPYAGASGGLFARVDDDSEGQRFSRNTFTFPMGVRLWVSNHLGVRGEYQIRRDNHELITTTSSEITGGVFWTF